jgi:adenosylcobyric acid synthase
MIGGQPDGATSRDGRIAGTYIHGCFASDEFRRAFLGSLGAAPSGLLYEHAVDETLDALADHCERNADLDLLLNLAERA